MEELALAYYMKKGYLVSRGVRFQYPKKKTGKSVAGWSDIDILALALGEVLIIQCKSFLGTEKSKEVARKITDHFTYAFEFLNTSEQYKPWLHGTRIRKILVVDYTVRETEKRLKDKDIEILYLANIVREMLQILKSKKGGKEDNILIRTLKFMIESGFIKEETLTTR